MDGLLPLEARFEPSESDASVGTYIVESGLVLRDDELLAIGRNTFRGARQTEGDIHLDDVVVIYPNATEEPNFMKKSPIITSAFPQDSYAFALPDIRSKGKKINYALIIAQAVAVPIIAAYVGWALAEHFLK